MNNESKDSDFRSEDRSNTLSNTNQLIEELKTEFDNRHASQEAEGDYPLDDLLERSRNRIVKEFFEHINPVMIEFIHSQITEWERHFRELTRDLIISRNRLASRVGSLEAMVKEDMLDNFEELFILKENQIRERELKVEGELKRIKSIQDTLSNLLTRPIQ